MAQDRDQWKALANAIKLRVPYNSGKFLSS
jgi:hypothetical protein